MAKLIKHSYLLLLIIAAINLGTAFAHGDAVSSSVDPENQAAHQLARQALCIDPASVLISFEDVDPNRTQSARAVMTPALSGALQSTLAGSAVSTSFTSSCAGVDGYVLVLVRVTYLDPNIYAGFGSDTYGYTLSLQSGKYQTSSYFVDHYVLPGLRFIAFDEEAYSEAGGAAPFEQQILARTQVMIDQLVSAWLQDNGVK